MVQFNWDDNRVFLALAREGTLSGAAAQLKSGVATVSRRIERMEDALGVPLFLRHQSGYSLTDQGEALLPRAEAVELAVKDMHRQASDHVGIRGQVRLASVESLVAAFIVPALAPLLADNPGLDVEIAFSTTAVNMHRHDADLALRMVRPERGNLVVRQLATMGFGLYGPADGAQPSRIVTWPQSESLAVPLGWSSAFSQSGSARFAVNTLAGQIEAVRRGIGRAVLPHFLAGEGMRRLADRLPDGSVMERPIMLVTHGDLVGSQRVASVAEAVAAEIIGRRRELSGR
ncbi:LysR family transcriptional regulator [Martelella lutilitoris]|uniref:LysR family transcriptional regulator n=1 Tax=Martelella lutilitoris TaxID=2583532 RepID=A0A5C4JV15_9HYPH|nr:LysR family transcriptional regulator [Martelella lutilitoris]TNB49256.1 LysR family transcriptional regulator [Martelella lutilitoris]